MNNYEGFLDIIKSRRSIRQFKNERVERTLIENALEAARWAPSACNKQAWRFIVVDETGLKQKLAARIKDIQGKKMMLETPAIIYVLYNRRVNPEKMASVQSAGAAIQNLLLALHAQGLGAVWHSQFFDRLVRKEFGIPSEFMIVAAILIGWPKKEANLIPPRLSLKQIAEYNNFTDRNTSNLRPDEWQIEDVASTLSRQIFATSPEIGFPYSRKEELKQILKIMNKEICPTDRILFILPYPGEVSFEWCRQNDNCNIDCVDISQEAIDWMEQRERALGIKLGKINYYFSLDGLIAEKKNYDVIILFETLNRLNKQDCRLILKEASKALSDRGKLLIFNANKYSYQGLFHCLSNYSYLSHFGPFKFLPSGYISRLLKEANLIIKEQKGINLFPSARVISNWIKQRWLKSIFSLFNFDNFEGLCTTGPLKKITRIQVFVAAKGKK